MKRNEIIHEHKKGVKAVKYNAKPKTHIEPTKPTNPVAKNANAAIGGGAAGAHKDTKKASQAVRGQKHKAQPEMAESRYNRRDAYQRDYDSSVSGMGRRQSQAYQDDGGANDERHDLDPSDWYIVKDGKMYKTSVYPNQEREAIARGYSRTREQAKARADSNPGSTDEATGDALGTISSTTPDGKVSIKTATGDEIKTDQSALMPGANGTVQMKPDAAGDALKPGAKVVSTETSVITELDPPPNDSTSPIHGGRSNSDHGEHSEIISLLRRMLSRR